MLRRSILLLSAGLLPACAALPDWSAPGMSFAPRHDSSAQFRFDWRLSGDRAVAPLQVFDDGRRTWLQFAPGQPVPAIFAAAAAQERLLSYRVEGPYVVLRGVWPRLVLRGGYQQSRVERIASVHGASSQLATAAVPSSFDGHTHTPAGKAGQAAVSAAGGQVAGARAVDTVAGDAASVTAHGTTATSVVAPVAASVAVATAPDDAVLSSPRAVSGSPVPGVGEASGGLASALTASSFSVPASPGASYRVSPHDVNIRLTLARWARQAGWTFEPEHWAADVDIPISGSAEFDTDFKHAVQQLVAATELADRPLQPCFYSNRVLRVVPFAQSCDRGLGSARAS